MKDNSINTINDITTLIAYWFGEGAILLQELYHTVGQLRKKNNIMLPLLKKTLQYCILYFFGGGVNSRAKHNTTF